MLLILFMLSSSLLLSSYVIVVSLSSLLLLMLLAAASIAAINPYFLRGYGETGSRNCNTTSDCHKVPWQCKRHAVRICWNVAFTGPIPQRQRSSELFAFWNLNILFLGYELMIDFHFYLNSLDFCKQLVRRDGNDVFFRLEILTAAGWSLLQPSPRLVVFKRRRSYQWYLDYCACYMLICILNFKHFLILPIL